MTAVVFAISVERSDSAISSGLPTIRQQKPLFLFAEFLLGTMCQICIPTRRSVGPRTIAPD